MVAGNFAKNPVVRYFDHEIFGELRTADHVDRQGLFVGNQRHAMPEAIAALGVLWRK